MASAVNLEATPLLRIEQLVRLSFGQPSPYVLRARVVADPRFQIAGGSVIHTQPIAAVGPQCAWIRTKYAAHYRIANPGKLRGLLERAGGRLSPLPPCLR